MNKVVFYHLYNDYSGSPRVLAQVISGILKSERKVTLITSSSQGFLSCFDDNNLVDVRVFKYNFSQNKFITSLYFIYAQIFMFLHTLRYYKDKEIILYLNTLMPIGAALAGRIINKKIICHYHENAFAKGTFYKVLSSVMQKLSTTMICVSDYQKSFLSRQKDVYVVNNALDIDYNHNYTHNPRTLFDRKTILLLGSLKKYKGIYEFIELAHMLTEFHFLLVVSDSMINLNEFINNYGKPLPPNIELYPKQSDVRPFYMRSSVLLNLSDRRFVIETFGLTAIEGMSFGLPVIVPSVGGIAELVKDGYNGYKIDLIDLNKIKNKLELILTDFDLYYQLSDAAYKCSSKYSYESMMASINGIITKTINK